jgi:tetratricopeptide (TPR) repeat protein
MRAVVTYAGGQEPVRNATVELMDSVGGGAVTDNRLTDHDGRVEFNTVTGSHRVRITADDCYPYEGEFQIGGSETFHIENFSLRRKPGSGAVTAETEGTNTVPLIRLKIPEKARKEFEKGSKAMEDKDWPSSRKHFQTAIELYPDYDLAYNGLGVACSELHDTPAARQAFLKATALNDKFAGAERNLARITLAEHNYEQSASLLNQSLTVEPGNAWALTNAAYAELELHRFKEAAEHALQVHALPHQGLANAHVIAAYALQALGRPTEAAAQWKLYLKEDPKGPNAKRAREELARLAKSPQS